MKKTDRIFWPHDSATFHAFPLFFACACLKHSCIFDGKNLITDGLNNIHRRACMLILVHRLPTIGGLFHHMVCIRGFSQLDFTDNCQKVLKHSIYFNSNPQLCFAFWALDLDPGCFPWLYSLLSLVLITSQTFPKIVPGSLTG